MRERDKMITYTYPVRMPTYALSYLINGDSSGLEEDDKRRIDNYMQQYYDTADQVNGSVTISPEEDIQSSYFTASPAFGLPCDCEDYIITILINEAPRAQPQPAARL